MKKLVPILLSSALVVTSVGALPQDTFAKKDKPVRDAEVITDVRITDEELVTNVDSSGEDLGYEMETFVDPNEVTEPAEQDDMEVFIDPAEPKVHKENVGKYTIGTTQPTVPSVVRKGNTPTTNVVVPDGAVYTWTYVNTTNGNNIAYNKVSNFLANAFIAGLSATVVGKIASPFWAGSAGYAVGKLGVPAGSNYWYTVKKWIDQDAYNIYFKYEIKYYSNSARTKLLKSYTYVERAK